MADIEALWAAHDRRLREALARLANRIPSDVRSEVEFLLDKREYGVALEGLSSYINDRHVDVDPQTQAILAALAADMGDDLL